MSTTIEDVARKAGVSTATVSRALRGLPNVAPSTRKQVLQAAEELGYTGVSHVQRPRADLTRTIGIAVPLTDAWFYTKVPTAAEIVLSNHGHNTMRYSIVSLDGQERLFKQLSSGRLLDGLITITVAPMEDQAELLLDSGLSVVTVESRTPQFPSVTCDNFAAAQTATRHLVNLGHRRIAIISSLARDPMQFSIPPHRKEGYLSVLREHEIEIRPEYDVPGNFSPEGGAEAMIELLSLREPPTAIFAFSDEMAIGALKTIRGLGLRVPEDISVIGFDDHDLAECFNLTTIRQPVAEYGELAAKLLVERLEGKQSDEVPHVVLATKLVIRSTTGACRAQQ